MIFLYGSGPEKFVSPDIVSCALRPGAVIKVVRVQGSKIVTDIDQAAVGILREG